MMSPRDIANKQFSKATFGGYRVEEVDGFLNEILDSYSELLKKQELHDGEIKVMSEKLEQYKNQENSLSAALIGAQKLGDNIIREAKGRADLVVRESGIKSDKMVDGARRERSREERELVRIQKEISDFKTRILDMYKSHLELISHIPTLENEEMPSIKSSSVRPIINNNSNSGMQNQSNVNLDSPINPPIGNSVQNIVNIEADYGNTEEKNNNEAENNNISQKQVGFVPNLGSSSSDDIEKAVENPIDPEYQISETYTPKIEDDAVKVADENYEKVDDKNKSSRFGELRFGENYQISREDEKKKTNKRRRIK